MFHHTDMLPIHQNYRWDVSAGAPANKASSTQESKLARIPIDLLSWLKKKRYLRVLPVPLGALM